MSKKTKLGIVSGLYITTTFFSWLYPLYFMFRTDGIVRIVGTLFGVMTIVFLIMGTSIKYIAKLEKEVKNDEQAKLDNEQAEAEKNVLIGLNK